MPSLTKSCCDFLNKILKKNDMVSSSTLDTLVVPNHFFEEQNNELYTYFKNKTEKNLHKWHHYFAIYEKHFARFRNKNVTVLEIGVQHGGSLKLWKNYFGENSKIIGVDIDPACKKFENKQDNIHVYIGSQSDEHFLSQLKNEIKHVDIVIDDGGHTTNQQIVSFNCLYDFVDINGVYLVEDVHTNYWKDFIDSKETFIEFAKRHIDALNAWFHTYSHNAFDENCSSCVPKFTNITHSISFYNSIIVFEKMKICKPKVEFR